jgi:hypothetical protein
MAPGQLAARLTHHQTRESISANAHLKLEFYFVKGASKANAKEKGKAKENGKKDDTNGSKSSIPKKRRSSGGTTAKDKGKGKATADDEDEGGSDLGSISFYDDDDGDEVRLDRPPQSRRLAGPSNLAAAARTHSDDYEEIDIYGSDLEDNEEDVVYDWSHSMRDEPRAKRRRKSWGVNEGGTQSAKSLNIVKEGDNEVMVLSSD